MAEKYAAKYAAKYMLSSSNFDATCSFLYILQWDLFQVGIF